MDEGKKRKKLVPTAEERLAIRQLQLAAKQELQGDFSRFESILARYGYYRLQEPVHATRPKRLVVAVVALPNVEYANYDDHEGIEVDMPYDQTHHPSPERARHGYIVEIVRLPDHKIALDTSIFRRGRHVPMIGVPAGHRFRFVQEPQDTAESLQEMGGAGVMGLPPPYRPEARKRAMKQLDREIAAFLHRRSKR